VTLDWLMDAVVDSGVHPVLVYLQNGRSLMNWLWVSYEHVIAAAIIIVINVAEYKLLEKLGHYSAQYCWAIHAAVADLQCSWVWSDTRCKLCTGTVRW